MISIKQQLTEDMKAAMRAKDKERLGAIRLALAAIKQQEVDQRIELDEVALLAVLDKMIRQRRESIRQYADAGRNDLVDQEQAEIDVLQDYLPKALSDEDVAELIAEAINETGAESIKDMGKVMAWIKPKAQGRADMGKVSGLIKARLAG